MRSIGLDLKPWVEKGLLRIHDVRPTLYGMEMHLASLHKMIRLVTIATAGTSSSNCAK